METKQLNKKTKKPLYLQLKDELRLKIENEVYHSGDLIPSEQQLMAKYGMSRITVRRAIEELSTEGYLVKVHGKGTFVTKPKIWRKLENLQSFTKACKTNNMTASHIVNQRILMSPTSEQREFLGLNEKSKVIFTSRTLLADNKPVMLEHCFFPNNKNFKFMTNVPLNRSLYDVLHEHNIYPSASRETTLEAVGASFDTSAILDIPVGEPTFYIVAFITDKEDNPLFVEHSYIVGSRYMYKVKQSNL